MLGLALRKKKKVYIIHPCILYMCVIYSFVYHIVNLVLRQSPPSLNKRYLRSWLQNLTRLMPNFKRGSSISILFIYPPPPPH